MRSCIYEGHIRHRRFAPVQNAFRYAMFMMLLDLEELPTLFERYWLWSNDGGGVARFRRRDHLKSERDLVDQPLLEAARTYLARRTGVAPRGPIALLTHLEYFRYRFNPVSFYYCYDETGDGLDTIIAEINNTPWGEQHCYVLPVRDSAAKGRKHEFEFDKEFHVSPFMGMDMRYDWRFTQPDATLAIHMSNFEQDTRLFDATLTLRRTEISARSLARVLTSYPFMTARVIAAIHWQALKLWLRRCPYYPHPKTYSEKTVGARNV